jgi:hypothetical protein
MTSTQYIVKFIKNTGDLEQDCYAVLNNNLLSTLTINTHKDTNHELNIILFYKVLTNNFAEVFFNDNTKECVLTYKDGYNKNKLYVSTIKFDEHSSSAYTEFKTELTVLINSKHESEYYPNGKLMYTGEVLYVQDTDTKISKRLPNGKGTLYYNMSGNHIKYDGDFESGTYDGSGKFYSTDGKICLVVNNISSGIPISVGKLYMTFNKFRDEFEINFIELWDKLKLNDKNTKKKFVMSDSFVNDIANIYWYNNDIKLDELIFREKSLDDKYTEIWNEVKTLQNQNKIIIDIQKKYINDHCNKNMIFYALLLIFTNTVLHFLF